VIPAFLATRRGANLAGFLVCLAMLVYALYAERVLGFEPCPLCMFQRVGVAILGAVFLLAALHDPTGRSGDPRGARIYGVLILLAAALPAYVAGRHVYIQSLPAGSVPSCGASLDYMVDVFPLMTVITKVLTGAGECQKIDWALFGLSMPAWVLVAVVGLGVFGAWANLRAASSLKTPSLKNFTAPKP
jgi:disulfide bond formation protein DsbB